MEEFETIHFINQTHCCESLTDKCCILRNVQMKCPSPCYLKNGFVAYLHFCKALYHSWFDIQYRQVFSFNLNGFVLDFSNFLT
jgi:hypothetical protein